jgi:hypothetical protein
MYGDLEIDPGLEVWQGLYAPEELYPEEGEEWEDDSYSKHPRQYRKAGYRISMCR